MSKGKLFLILGASGVGKSTLINNVLDRIKGLEFVPSYTTRTPRTGEKDGVDYFFVSTEKFHSLIEQDAFIEIDQPHNTYYYGIPKEPTLSKLESGISIIRTVAINGLDQMLKSPFKEYVFSVFIMPDKNYDLKEKLRSRDGKIDPDRIEKAKEEMEYAKNCDYIITSIEGKPEIATGDLERIIREQTLKND